MTIIVDNVTAEQLATANGQVWSVTSTVTSAGTLSLTSAATYYQIFTGSTSGQKVALPSAATIATGWTCQIINFSSTSIVVTDALGNALTTISASNYATCICTGTGIGSPIGLLLALTYANTTVSGAWTILIDIDNASQAVSRIYYAGDLDSPNNSDWTVNQLAPASADSLNPSLVIRQFDDTASQGVGFTAPLPSSISNITFTFKGRPQTTPGSSVGVVLQLYTRSIPNNAAVTTWSSAYTLTTLSVPTNTYFQYYSQTIPLSSLGLTAGNTVQFELIRYGAAAADTLVGNWNLLELQLVYS